MATAHNERSSRPVSAAAPRAALYSRVSTNQQEDNFSLATQEAACREYAAVHGYTVAAVYREVYSGASLWERAQLTALRESIRQGEIDVVIAYAVDRLSREQAHLYILDDEWERADVAMEFATEEFDKTPIGKVIRSLKGFVAEAEREKIRERTMRGAQARLAAGRLKPGRNPLYGYCWRDERRGAYDLNPATAPVVRRMFEWAAEGATLREICRRLDADGTPTYRGAVCWKHTVISATLNNPAYKGEAWANRRAVTIVKGRKIVVTRPQEEQIRLPDGTIPAIVDADLWEAVQVRMQRNKAEAPRNSRNPQAFLARGGYVRCGHCGRGVDAVWKKNRSGERVAVYRVLTAGESHHGCPSAHITARELDGAVDAYLRLAMTRPHMFTAQIRRLQQNDTSADDLATVDGALASIKKRQRNLTHAIAALDDADAAAPLIAELRSLGERKKELEAERAIILGRQSSQQAAVDLLTDLSERASEIAANYDEMPYEAKRDLLAALDVRVRFFPANVPDRIVIESDLGGLLRQIVSASPP